jgi:ubiquinone/menaquinone biosynthesis C-methylase UbiE
MHPSSINNMKKARDMIRAHIKENMTILDVGGRALNPGLDRSYRPIWQDVAENYYVADIVAGYNVTHHMPGPYTIPLEDQSVDLVVSGQTLEHVKNPFRSVAEMKRCMKVGACIILIAPSTGKYHDSIDCWRFMDDSFPAIAEEVSLKVIAHWVDRSAPDERSQRWQDHVFIGQRTE